MGKNKQVLVSVVMPVYNNEKYVSEAIESILNQSYANFEFIIIDDCSTDRTSKIISRFKDKRIRYYKNERNLGCTKSLNRALKLANGEVIARMDSDDYCDKDRFKMQLDTLNKENADVCGCNLIFIDKDGKEILKARYDLNNIDKSIKIWNPIAHPTVLIKKKVLDRYGYYDERFSVSQDYDLWLRLWSKGCKFCLDDNFLYYYRQHEKTAKNLKTKKIIKTVLKIKLKAIREYGVRFNLKQWLRFMMEAGTLLLPKKVILWGYYKTKK
jgi:glycosyltransferase involved in cell wall biosynthesis